MWHFAWRNLLSRPARTLLAVVGLSIPIFGILGLLSLSSGVRRLVGGSLDKIPGILVLRENVLSPVVSDLPADLGPKLKALPGVRTVAPEVWKIAPTIEGRSLFARSASSLLGGGSGSPGRSLFELTVVEGQDIAAHTSMRSTVFKSRLLPPEKGGGRYLEPADRDQPRIVISTKIARENPHPEGRPRQVGDTLRLGSTDFTIIGLYETGSLVFDVTILMDIDMARRLLHVDASKVSSYLVEPEDPRQTDALVRAIDQALPDVDARSMAEMNLNVGRILGDLDVFLMLIVSLALLVGAIGILNTMLMSTTERSLEFGILRAQGWSRSNVLRLVTTESGYLGLLSGLAGSALALVVVTAANLVLSDGMQLRLSPAWIPLAWGLSIVMGTLGGLYPAWRASNRPPMEAIRGGGGH